MKINCDIGERGHEHPVDRSLMEWIDIANIACGGHAGDEESVRTFRELADQFQVEVSAHLSYPDRVNFGRSTISMEIKDLLESLDDQYSLMSDVKMVKYHGALYNDCAADPELASVLADWLKAKKIDSVITQYDSELAVSCRALGIKVRAEAFAERQYAYNPLTGKLSLVSRNKEYASIHKLDDAVAHSKEILSKQSVNAFIDDGERIFRKDVPLAAETICIHSDSPIAMDLVRALKEVIGERDHA